MATRRERVVLELEDLFTPDMLRAAAATAILKKELGGLSGRAVETDRTTRFLARDTDDLGKSAGKSGKEIDRLSGRMRILADVALLLGPAFEPIAAVGIVGLTGMTAQLGFASVALGTTVLAVQGLGDALKAVNKAQLEPTAENLLAARVALEDLSPAAQKFVHQIEALTPQFKALRDVAAEGLLPGVSDGLDALEASYPRVQRILSSVSSELGAIASESGHSLASDRWKPFLDFIATEAPVALSDMSKAAGNTAHALAGLWMATTPLNEDFSTWLVNATADLDRWSNGLEHTEGFHEFVQYVETEGPRAAETLGSIANAALQIVEAASPLGGPTLRILGSLADVVAKVADSPLGTPIFTMLSAFALLNRTLAVTGTLQKTAFGGQVGSVTSLRGAVQGLARDMQTLNRVSAPSAGFIGPMTREQAGREAALGRTQSAAAGIAKTAAALTAVTVASTGAADSIGLTNTISLGLAGSMAGPVGAGIGATVGQLLDAKAASDKFTESLRAADTAMATDDIDGLTDALAKMQAKLDDLNHNTGTKDGISDTVGNILGGDTITKLSGAAALLAPANPAALAAALTHGFGLGKTGAEEFSAKIQQSQKALIDLKRTADATAKQALLNDGFKATAAGIDSATQSAKAFTQAIARVNEVLTGRSAARDYEAAVDDFTKALKDNGKTLDINTAKGRENQAALDNIASSAIKFAQSLQDPALRAQFLDQARAQFVKAATAAGMAKKAARELATQVGLLNTVKGTPKLDLDASAARTTMDRFMTSFLALNNRVVTPTVSLKVHVPPGYDQDLANLLLPPLQSPKPKHRHKGGAGVKTKAYGGYISGPGGPRDDQIPAWLSNGEYVMPADVVDHYGVDAMDDMRAMRFADGGRVNLPADGPGKNKNKPLFTHEGPHWYAAAYRHNRPFAKPGPASWDWPYQTGLDSAAQVHAFNNWVRTKGVPFNVNERITDYDMRGFWKKTRGRGWHKGSHFPDTYKTPYDTTFSHESKYATKNNPFYWHGDRLIDERSGQVVFAADGGLIRRRRGSAPAARSARPHARGRRVGYANGGDVLPPVPVSEGSTSHHSSSGTKAETHAHKALIAELHRLQASLKASSAAIDKEKQKRSDLVSQRTELISTTGDQFRTNIFGASTRPSNWEYMSAAARQTALQTNPFATISADTANATAFEIALKKLASEGLHGKAFGDLATSGDLEQAKALGALPASQIVQLEKLYDLREKAAGSVGTYAGVTVYNKQIAETNTHLKAMQAQNKALQSKVDHLEKSLKGAAKSHAAEVTARGKASRGARAASVRTRKKGG